MGIVELPRNCDAMEYSNAQRWLKSVLTPTSSILENEGRAEAESCQVLLTEVAQLQSPARLKIRNPDLKACLDCPGRKPIPRILDSIMNEAGGSPTRKPMDNEWVPPTRSMAEHTRSCGYP